MKQRFHLLLVLSLSLLGFNHAEARAITAAPKQAQTLPSLAPMLQQVMPAVVNVAVQGILPPTASSDDGKPRKKGPRRRSGKPRKFESLGSGVVIDANKGYIITNAHVVANAKTITTTLNDGRRLKAKLIGADRDSDIAVLQVKAKNLASLKVGDSNDSRVGDFVVAIGNPFGLNSFGNSQTATFGIISALQRNDLNIEGVENFIQTDAAINPGNSGGALVNTRGELIGINTAIITPFGGNVGIGFAIPIDMAKDVMQQLIKYGSIHRGLMGIFVQHLTPELANAFGLDDSVKGALVTQVNQDSPAEKAGLKTGDIIRNINGNTINDASQVKNIVGLLRVGSSIEMQVLRNKKLIKLHAVVTDVKQHEQNLQSKNPFLYGLALQNFDQKSPLHGYVEGVQIVGASESSAGWRAGLRPGDVIIEANQVASKNINSLQQAATRSKTQMLVHLLRGSGSLFIVVK